MLASEVVIISPDVILLGKEPIEQDGVPAMRYRYDVRGHDVQVIATEGSDYLTVFVDDYCDMVAPRDLRAHVKRYAR